MKKGILYILLFAFVLSACDKTVEEYGEGTVNFTANLSDDVTIVSTAKSEGYQLDSSLLPQSSDFSLTISGTEYYQEYSSISDYDSPLIAKGDYLAKISYGNNTEEGLEKPCFYGEEDFTIVARAEVSESIIAKLSNSIFKLDCTEMFDNYYPSYDLKITTELGTELNFDESSDSNLIFFVKENSALYLSGTATKTNGYDVSFNLTKIITSTTPQTLHSIIVDAESAGTGYINISVDMSLTEVPVINLELNPESEN